VRSKTVGLIRYSNISCNLKYILFKNILKYFLKNIFNTNTLNQSKNTKIILILNKKIKFKFLKNMKLVFLDSKRSNSVNIL
jgi:hypothetical protein